VPSIRARFFPASPPAIETSPSRANISARLRVTSATLRIFRQAALLFRTKWKAHTYCGQSELYNSGIAVPVGIFALDSKTGARGCSWQTLFFSTRKKRREARHSFFLSSVGTSRERVNPSRCPARSTS
jgi:hypothetical protein